MNAPLPDEKVMPKMTAAQQKYLRERINSVGYGRVYHDKETEPARVKQARATIKAWEESVRREQENRRREYGKAQSAALEALHFKGPNDALAAVRVFESKWGGK